MNTEKLPAGIRSELTQHIKNCYGSFKKTLHETASPDIPLDIFVIPPSEKYNYFTLVTSGISDHIMPVSKELLPYKLQRTELLICLPSHWNLDSSDETWHWPVTLLKELARRICRENIFLTQGSVFYCEQAFSSDTNLCGGLLIYPPMLEENQAVCSLSDKETVNFYQIIPLYYDEIYYGETLGAESLLHRLSDFSFVVNPHRLDCMDTDETSQEEAAGLIIDMGEWHLESIQEKHLPLSPNFAFNHMAVWIIWCKNHQFLNKNWAEKFPDSIDLIRNFIRDELQGKCMCTWFIPKIQDFLFDYYGGDSSWSYLEDISHFTLDYFKKNPSELSDIINQNKEEAYLFLPYNHHCIHGILDIIEQRYEQWKKL